MGKNQYYKQFLKVLFLVWLASFAILLWGVSLGHALSFSAGFAAPLLFAWKYPRYQPDPDGDESILGVQ